MYSGITNPSLCITLFITSSHRPKDKELKQRQLNNLGLECLKSKSLLALHWTSHYATDTNKSRAAIQKRLTDN